MNEAQELRLYTWTLFQLSPIQQGIQAAHAAVELAMKTSRERGEFPEAWQTYCHWGENWATMICLNGGNVAELQELIGFFDSIENPYPWAAFHESDDALGGLPTSVALLLPVRIFGTADEMRRLKPGYQIQKFGFTEYEWELMERLASAGLAR